MKVLEVMRKSVEHVSNDTSIREVARIIFGRGINGLPVCKNRKVVGFITEHDILAKFYPTMGEYIDDPFHSSDFERMERKISEVLDISVEKIMSKNPITITSDMPVLKAQSLMFVNKIGRLPVVNKKGNLIGIITNGDIFASVVGNKLALQEEEGFYNWSAKLYDTMINWKTRLSNEIPDLESLFKKQEVKKVVDIASSTGEHSIALASKGFEVFGVEYSGLMSRLARLKRIKFSNDVQSRIKFFQGKYEDTLKKINDPIDAAIFMGNTLPHVQYTDQNILKRVVSILRQKDPLMVFQIVNFNKVLRNKTGLRDFTIREEKDKNLFYKSHAFLGFYTKKDKDIIYTRAVFSSVGDGIWVFSSINSTSIQEITKSELEKALNELGFSHVSFYGSNFDGPLFREPFNELESDWLNVIAKR